MGPPSLDYGKAWGWRWRSSKPFIIVCISIALFTESFLYSFVIPILPYLLEERNHVDHSDIQRLTYQILTLYGVVSIVSAIFIGMLADLAKTRKMPLIISLGVAIVGTFILAAATNLWALYVGRVLQSIGGTAAWIIGVATLRATIDARHIGKAFGLVYSCVSAGALCGPAIAGLLLSLSGYWVTWGAVFVVLALDIVMRLIMLERQEASNVSNSGEEYIETPGESGEESLLISGTDGQEGNAFEETATEEPAAVPAAAFYRTILVRKRVLVALLCSMIHSAMIASYGTTIPTHVKFAFGWDSLPTGLLFAALQVPTIFASPLYGWLRDRFGTRKPAAFGFVLLAPVIWLLGAADQKQFPWASSEHSAKVTYVTAVIGIGFVTNLMSSVSAFEITCVVDDLESMQPGIFGPNGGYSRSYSLSNLAFAAGLVLGPLLSGTLADSVGYYLMNSVLACICAAMSLMAFIFLEDKSTVQPTSSNDDE